MTDSAPQLRRHFLAWDRPLVPQLAAWLAGDWRGPEPLDLSRVLAVVPTRQSGRRLREALAAHAAARGGAVFPPQVQTPDALLADGAEAPDVASRLEALLAWTEVLRDLDPAAVPDVFPVPPAQRDFGWAWRLAESFGRLQDQLNEGGLALADVARRMGPDFSEHARWEQLAGLEAEQVRRLAESDEVFAMFSMLGTGPNIAASFPPRPSKSRPGSRRPLRPGVRRGIARSPKPIRGSHASSL